MLYYLGKGNEFKKEECKEYKTLKNVLAAAAKDEALTVWDENGVVVGGLTDHVPEGALETNADGSVNAYDEDSNLAGTVDAENISKLTGDSTEAAQNELSEKKMEDMSFELENGDNEADTTEGDGGKQDNIIVPQGTMKVTVVCDGTLNIRRSPAWGNGNICGRAIRGQSYYVKEIHTVEGKKMVRTIDDLYLSGLSEHVQFEQL